MRKLAIPFGAARRRQAAVEEEEAPYFDPTNPTGYDDNIDYDEKQDYDSFGSLPKGEVSRRLRYGKEPRPGRAGSPVGVRLRLDGMSSASSTMSKPRSTVGRAAVSVMPPMRRHHRPMSTRDPPSGDRAGEPDGVRRQAVGRDQGYYEEHDYGYEVDRRMYEEENFQDYDEFAVWSDPRRQTRAIPLRSMRAPPSPRRQPPESVWSDDMTDEQQWEEESDGRGYTGLEIEKVRSLRRTAKSPDPESDMPPRRPPQGPKSLIRVRSNRRNDRDSFSDSMASSLSSGAPKYTPEDSRFLLAENDVNDWAELPTQQDDPELRHIRKQFLRQDNSTISSNASLGNSTLTSRSDKWVKGNLDTEGLPTGFYRRKDGVILSMESSVGSSTNRQSTRYTNSITEASAMETTLETREDNKYAMDVEEETEESNSIMESTLSETIQDSTVISRDSRERGKGGQKDGLVAAFAQSFEDQIYYLRTGLELDPKKKHKTPLNKRRARVRNGSVASSTSTPSTVRRAKVKQNGPKYVSTLPKTREPHKVPPIPTSTMKKPPHPLEMQHLDEQTSGSGYDDSTITTKDTAMQRKKAIIDTSRIPEEDQASYLQPPPLQDPPSRDHSIPKQSKQRKETATDSIDLAKQHSDRKIALQAPSDDGFFHKNSSKKGSSKKTVGFAGAYPEPTRRGDRVPELIASADGANPVPSVVSDISSLPRSKSKDAAFDTSSVNGYGGFTVEDKITGFIDKMALALRDAVFQQAKGCTEIKK